MIAHRGSLSFLSVVSSLTLTLGLVGTSLIGCNQQTTTSSVVNGETTSIRPLSEQDALSDYDSMIASIRSLYGPLEYKERRFGYSFETEAASVRAKFATAKSDFEKQALFFELLRKLQDGHVSLQQPIRERYEIPIILMPVEGKFLISRIAPQLAPYGLAMGDEILSVDGMTPEDALKIITKYTWFANDESDRHMIFYFMLRPSYIPELAPKGAFAQIEFAKPDGTKKIARVAWKKTSPQQRVELGPKASKDDSDIELKAKKTKPETLESKLAGTNSMVSETLAERLETEASIGELGATAPWFWNGKLKKKYAVTMVTPERERVQQFYALWTRELNIFDAKPAQPDDMPETLPTVWAAIYKYNGKTVLMMRQPSYVVDDIPLQLAIYSALIDQFQPIADTLVLDQTHNPGGAVIYGESFAQLFAPNGMNSFVQFLNNDRLWFTKISSYWTSLDAVTANSAIGARLLSTAKNLERDSEAGLRLTQDPFSFSMREVLPAAPGGAVWKKPVLVLIDELCASGGDAVPMMLKANKLAKLFGNRTSGMGGSVEKVIDLPFTRATLNLTRGLFTTFKPDGNYTDADFVENNGVTPDVEYKHTVKDVRDGFDAYFKAFSDEATK
jgi:hypothetical protein